LLELGGVRSPGRVADLHIGTYRISYLLGDLLPSATIESVDIWEDERYEIEPTLRLLRELESVPAERARLRVNRARSGKVPLPDASCDAVVLGLGLHEIPAGSPREEILSEAKRVLKPNGRLLLFEHTVDLQSLLVFGPGIAHWVRRSEWIRLMRRTFGNDVQHRRSPEAVDLFVAAPGD
jgi:SAM-dependent methyltransferase